MGGIKDATLGDMANAAMNVFAPVKVAKALASPVAAFAEKNIANTFARFLAEKGLLNTATGLTMGAGQLASDTASPKPKTVSTAISDAEKTALAGSLIGMTGDSLLNAGGHLIKGITNSFSKVPSYALNYAREHPEVITNPGATMASVANQIKETLPGIKQSVQDAYVEGINSIGNPRGSVHLSSIPSVIKNMDINQSWLEKQLLSATESSGSLDEVQIKNMLAGKFTSLESASKLNAALSAEVGNYKSILNSADTAKLKAVKNAIVSAMDEQWPGIRGVNRNYAQAMERLKSTESMYGNPATAESKLHSVAQSLLDPNSSKKTIEATEFSKMFPELIEPLRRGKTFHSFHNAPDATASSVLAAGGISGAAASGLTGIATSMAGGFNPALTSAMGGVGGAFGGIASAALSSPGTTEGLLQSVLRTQPAREAAGEAITRMGQLGIPSLMQGNGGQ